MTILCWLHTHNAHVFTIIFWTWNWCLSIKSVMLFYSLSIHDHNCGYSKYVFGLLCYTMLRDGNYFHANLILLFAPLPRLWCGTWGFFFNNYIIGVPMCKNQANLILLSMQLVNLIIILSRFPSYYPLPYAFSPSQNMLKHLLFIPMRITMCYLFFSTLCCQLNLSQRLHPTLKKI